MSLIPIEDFTKHKLWEDVHRVTFSPELNFHQGTDVEKWSNPPDLRTFITNISTLYNNGQLKSWGILVDGVYVGHSTLLRKGEDVWEIGTVLADPDHWNKGYGVRATLHAMKWAFDNGAAWVIAFTQGKDPRVNAMLKKGGFKTFLNMEIIDKETHLKRWARSK